jgi:hypothetical protein
MTRINPYQSETMEYALWETWNRDFFKQPAHAQVLEVESQIREQVHTLILLIQQLEAGQLRRQLTDCTLELESSAEDLGEIAEHQYLLLVTRDGNDAPGSDQLKSVRRSRTHRDAR